ncbi:hypothetical protein B0A50_00409 [Salinomyces thailandicus]|uniref:Tautomerase cis-CaaD-like domain-containing protein n=1 Tax=Salinomyces thailandicus TaxID=706561 RepID=A0A4U0UDM5_9PEZI|nr:hypothetical protein B0A50_00409 [Salinomyces thailandica]
MPLYEIQHHIPLTVSQKDDLATAITNLHATKFRTPKMFVNVTFTDVSATRTYIGGKPRQGNHVKANVRSGPSRTKEDWEELCKGVMRAWEDVVGKGLPKVRRGDGEVDTSLRSVILLGDIIGGVEAGFMLPEAGGDVEWMRENWESFQRKAAEGNEEFKEMVEEVGKRGLLESSGGEGAALRAQQARLEEMMGWGEYA